MFPAITPGGSQAFQATIISSGGTYEIVKVTGRTGDVLNLVRGQEGTPAASFAIGSLIELRTTALLLSKFLQKEVGGTIGGNIDMSGNNINNVGIPGIVRMADILVNTLRGPDRTPGADTPENIMQFPTGKKKVLLGGHPLLNSIVFARIVFDWSGDPRNIEPWWMFCDGTRGTPDLRDVFILGADPAKLPGEIGSVGKRGGDFYQDTEDGGNHSHGAATGDTKLELANVPSLRATENSREDDNSTTKSITMIEQVNDAVPHHHTINPSGPHKHRVPILPPYYRLAKVMLNPDGFD
jgi:hypothetical protein